MNPFTMLTDEVAESRTDEVCGCGHSIWTHVTVHRGGCIGRPLGGCGPDCNDECDAEGCGCREYDPRRSPSTRDAAKEDGNG